MRFDTSIGLKSRKRLELANFRGVDLTSSPMQVATSRAAESYNLIPENGINRKRPGWESLFALGARINGIFPFDEGDSKVLLVHAGDTFYRFRNDASSGWEKTKLIEGVNDERTQCFYRDNKAFIVGAREPLVYGLFDGSYQAKKISEIAYVPTTTTKITASNEKRTSLDKVNLLTAWRKNECIFPDNDSGDGMGVAFLLDGLVNTEHDVEITIPGYESLTITSELKQYFLKSKDYPGLGTYVTTQIGRSSITFSFNSTAWPAVKGSDLTVKFCAAEASFCEQGPLDCRFGAVFGVDGKSNRLFLSGNPAYPNRDWWSEQDDFTYFPDGNTMEVGSSGSAITGYARLSDSTMAVFKDGAAGDATIYYRTGKTVTVTDETEFSHEEAIFPAVAGTAGEGLLTPFGVANLSGDVLMLGREGVYGIELSSNVASVERYTRERSRAIYGDLRRRSFTDAAMAVYGGRLYMAPHDGSGICYVADARYRASFEGADAGYEWWVWDHIPARVFAVYQDRLLFGDERGRVCAFEEGTFADRASVTLKEGDIAAMDSNGVFTYGEQIKPKDGDHILVDAPLYAQLYADAEITDDEKVKIPDDENVYLKMYDGMKLWVDNVGESGLNTGKAYSVRNFDPGRLTFSLEGDGKLVKLSAGGFRLSVQCTEAVVCDVDATNQKLGLKSWGAAPLPVICYNNTAAALSNPRLIETTPVVATWLSGTYDLGTYMDRKTLLGLSVATAEGCGTVRFGFETAKHEAEWRARGIKGLDFDNIDFDNFTFLTPFAGSVTKRMNVRNFNFIRFLYRSEGDEDCAVAGLTVLYKINQTNRGMF